MLEETLNAWRDGESPGAMTGSAAGTRVGEPKWEEGYRLVRFEIGEEARQAGFDLQFTVSLSMNDPRGEPVDETVRYVVSTHPARTVIRSAF